MGTPSIDVDDLLGEASEQPPCGPNLEYDDRFIAIERAATRIPAQEIGDHKTEPVEPRWADVLELSQAFLKRSKDLRVAGHMVRALVQTDGVAGLGPGLALVRGFLERYWGDLYPRIEDDGDATMRRNALAPLTSVDALLGDLRGAFLVNSPGHGQLRVRDVEVALGRLPGTPGTEAPGIDRVRLQLGAALEAGNGTRSALDQAVESVTAMRTILAEKVGLEEMPDWDPLLGMLLPLKRICDEVAAAAGDDSGGGAAAGAVVAPASVGGEIRSRDDAIRLLDKVCDYLERHEPANPAPLLIRRAQRLMRKNFVEIVQDLLPDSLSQIETLAGLPRE